MKNTLLLLPALLICMPVFAQENQEPIVAKMEGNVFKPAKREATPERIKSLKVPAGFTVAAFATGLEKPRMVAVSPHGHVYTTNREKGTLTLLTDANKDGKADSQKQILQKDQLHGMAIHEGTMYLVTVKEVFAAPIKTDGTLGDLKLLLKDLPDGGQHPNRTIAVGPDKKLYITVGSTCNACEETSSESATIVTCNLDGSGRTIWAIGLRNTIGFDWHPGSGNLYGMDHGIDWLGDETQREELNHLQQGKNYGWPYLYENNKPNPADQPKGKTYEEYAKECTVPLLTYTAHASPLGMVFYRGTQFPAEYRGDAFVTMHGSWNRAQPAGYSLVRVRMENGKPARFEEFMSGFLIEGNKGQFGRPCGITQHPDGSLLMTDDSGGVIYRISYAETGKKKK